MTGQNACWPGDASFFGVGFAQQSGSIASTRPIGPPRDAPPTDAELSEAKNELLAGALRERETIEGRASALGYALIVDGDAASVNTELAKLQAVTAADVQRVAKKYMAEDRRMTIRYRPESERPKGEAVAATPAPPIHPAGSTGSAK